MSNKLVKHQESKELLSGKQKEILFWICFIILSIFFHYSLDKYFLTQIINKSKTKFPLLSSLIVLLILDA